MELADVAQLVVHRTCNAKVAGSSPVISSQNYWPASIRSLKEVSVSDAGHVKDAVEGITE